MPTCTLSGRTLEGVSPDIARRWDGRVIPGLVDAYPVSHVGRHGQLLVLTDAGIVVAGDRGDHKTPWARIAGVREVEPGRIEIETSSGAYNFVLDDPEDSSDLVGRIDELRPAVAQTGPDIREIGEGVLGGFLMLVGMAILVGILAIPFGMFGVAGGIAALVVLALIVAKFGPSFGSIAGGMVAGAIVGAMLMPAAGTAPDQSPAGGNSFDVGTFRSVCEDQGNAAAGCQIAGDAIGKVNEDLGGTSTGRDYSSELP